MLQLFLIASVGFALVRLKTIDYAFIRSLSLFLIDVALPCWLFTKLIGTERGDLFSSLMFPAAGILVIGTGFLIGLVACRIMGIRDESKKAGWALAGLGNSGYIPLSISETLPIALPAVAVLLPDETAALYIGMYLVTMNPILWTAGNYLVAGGREKPRFSHFFTPPAFSVVAGVLVVLAGGGRLFTDNGSVLFYVGKTAETIGRMALPTVLICLGGMIGRASMEGFSRGKAAVKFISTVVTIRMVIMPGLFFLFYFATRPFITLTPVQYWVLFLEMITPPATNLSVMAAKAGRNEGLVAQTLFFGYIAYFVIFPFYLALFLALPVFQ